MVISMVTGNCVIGPAPEITLKDMGGIDMGWGLPKPRLLISLLQKICILLWYNLDPANHGHI